MTTIKSLLAAAFAGATLLAAPQASASLVGVPTDSFGNILGNAIIENRPLLGGDAIGFFIPFGEPGDGTCTYGVDDVGGGNICGIDGGDDDTDFDNEFLDLFLRFDGVDDAVSYVLNLNFEDLDLIGLNDGGTFLEEIDILSADGMTSLSGGPVTDILNMIVNVSGDADTQMLALLLGDMLGDPFIVRLRFSASGNTGTNTIEYLTAELRAVPIPAALPLFLAGLAGLGFAGRNKKKVAR